MQTLNITQVSVALPFQKVGQKWSSRIREEKQKKDAFNKSIEKQRKRKVRDEFKEKSWQADGSIESKKEEKAFATVSEQTFDLRAASVPASYRPPRRSGGRKTVSNLLWSPLRSPERPSSQYGPSITTQKKPKVPKIVTESFAPKMAKYNSNFLSLNDIADENTFLFIPSPSARRMRSPPTAQGKIAYSYRSSLHSARSRDATTAAVTDASLSARSSTIGHSRYDSEMNTSTLSGTVKIADLLNRTIDPSACSGSNIRRDMFGNLRAVPEHKMLRAYEESDSFIAKRRGHDPDLDPLLNPHLYVDNLVERLSRTLDVRGVNHRRKKFSGKHGLKGYWNPYLMMSNRSKYAQISNPNL